MATFSDPLHPNIGDYTLFLRHQVGVGPLYLPDNSQWINTTFDVALQTVSLDIQAVAPSIYTLAVYNLAADRLINYALDEEGQNYFMTQRERLKIGGGGIGAFGVVSSTSDSGTSVSLLNPEAMKNLTIQDLEMLQTPWGRRYLGFAQAYGHTIWGLS